LPSIAKSVPGNRKWIPYRCFAVNHLGGTNRLAEQCGQSGERPAISPDRNKREMKAMAPVAEFDIGVLSVILAGGRLAGHANESALQVLP
jgi:hypothetical protein